MRDVGRAERAEEREFFGTFSLDTYLSKSSVYDAYKAIAAFYVSRLHI